AVWDFAEPSEQWAVEAWPHAFHHALHKVMMRRDKARINDTTRCVEPLFAWLGIEVANRGDAPVLDPDATLRAHRISRQAGENAFGAFDQNRRHATHSHSAFAGAIRACLHVRMRRNCAVSPEFWSGW